MTVLKAWGFQFKAEVVWIKTTSTGKLHFGMGRQVRYAHEVCLIGTKGKPARLSRAVRSVFYAPTGQHSEKPEEFIDQVVTRLSPGPYVEIFARKSRPDWACFGEGLEEAKM